MSGSFLFTKGSFASRFKFFMERSGSLVGTSGSIVEIQGSFAGPSGCFVATFLPENTSLSHIATKYVDMLPQNILLCSHITY